MGAKCCSDRKKAVGDKDGDEARREEATIKIQKATRGKIARTKVNLVRRQLGLGEAADTAEELRRSVDPEQVICCVLGSANLEDSRSLELVVAVASRLASDFGERVAFVTRGSPGAERCFAKHCGDGMGVWNLVPLKANSGFEAGADIQIGKDQKMCLEIFSKVGDVYLTVEGDAEVSSIARAACDGGAVVLPIARTGGASSGLHDFPPEALKKPEFVAAEDWALLANKEASMEDVAGAISTTLGIFTQARLQALEAHRVAAARWQSAGKTIRLARSCTDRIQRGGFKVEDAVGKEEAAQSIEEAFDGVSTSWKPRQTGGRTSISSFGKPEAPDRRQSKDGLHAPEMSRETYSQVRLRREAAPPPLATSEVGDEAKALLGDIESSREKMKAKLDAVHEKVSSASTKLQAMERGRQTRKTMKAAQAGQLVESTEEVAPSAGDAEAPGVAVPSESA